MDEPADRVALALGAVEKIVGGGPRGAGVFVFAHSLGCELALRMTVEIEPDDVLGVELAGTGVALRAGRVKEMSEPGHPRRHDR